MSAMQEGTQMVKLRGSSKGLVRFYYLDEHRSCLRWRPSRKNEKAKSEWSLGDPGALGPRDTGSARRRWPWVTWWGEGGKNLQRKTQLATLGWAWVLSASLGSHGGQPGGLQGALSWMV